MRLEFQMIITQWQYKYIAVALVKKQITAIFQLFFLLFMSKTCYDAIFFFLDPLIYHSNDR